MHSATPSMQHPQFKAHVLQDAFASNDQQLLEELINLIAEVTRYPREVLVPDADLENDLGIDSVKRGEILVAIRRRFDLDENLQNSAEAFRTIRSATSTLASQLIQRVSHDKTNSTEKVDTLDMLAELTVLVAEVTRYPVEVLEPEADFENDLGIDSVKRGEILVAVRQRFNLPEEFQVSPESFRSLASAAAVLSSFVSRTSRPARESLSASVPAMSANQSAPSFTSEMAPLLPRLRSLVARVTRYPEEIIEPSADFEHDLGIDSVKRGEILVAVRQELGLSSDVVVPPESFRTLESATRALEVLLQMNRAVSAVDVTSATEMPDAAFITSEQTTKAKVQSPIVTPIDSGEIKIVQSTSNVEGVRPNYLRDLNEIFCENGSRPFTGKIALITGSGRGLGKDIAKSLARLGATVIINAFHSREDGERTTTEIIREGGDAHFVWGSVASPQQREAMFDQIEKRGGLDFFISNASNGLIGPFDQISDEHWAKGFQTNIVGLHQCTLRAAPMMLRRGGGKIITLSTPVSNRHVADFSCMAALKASVESLTRSMAVEFEKYRVSVNCVSAGAVYGELIKKFPDSDSAIRYWEEKSLGKRLVYSQEICNFINFLLSGAADAINGSVLVIDGGITIRL